MSHIKHSHISQIIIYSIYLLYFIQFWYFKILRSVQVLILECNLHVRNNLTAKWEFKFLYNQDLESGVVQSKFLRNWFTFILNHGLLFPFSQEKDIDCFVESSCQASSTFWSLIVTSGHQLCNNSLVTELYRQAICWQLEHLFGQAAMNMTQSLMAKYGHK